MVVAVVATFLLLWGPLHVLIFMQHVMNVEFNETIVIILLLSNCIAYMNACLNPIIYGFNQDFRK